jgi:hypothetical protein
VEAVRMTEDEVGRDRMNETHAQFFRELRELCEKYKATLYANSEGELEVWLPGAKYYDFRFAKDSTSFDDVEFCDAAQKEGEK